MDTLIIGILLCNLIYKGIASIGPVFDKSDHGITNANLMDFPIPADLEEVWLEDNDISWIPVGYFKNVSVLLIIDLYSNQISDIQDFAFAAAPSIEKIDLNNNKLSIIKKLMFSGLPHLEVLDLHDNEIHTLEVDCFRENEALLELYLQENEISVITKLTFSGLQHLEVLKLHKNAIHTLELDCFRENAVLEVLTLQHNQLHTLPQCIFDGENHPTGLHHLAVHNNPLVCDSSWCWVRQAEQENWITLKLPQQMVCTGPELLADQKWNHLSTLDICTGRKGCKFMISGWLVKVGGSKHFREQDLHA